MTGYMEPLEIIRPKGRVVTPYAGKMQRRIQRGVIWLNSRPHEWWDDYAREYELDRASLLDGNWLNLDTDLLDLENSSACVLGQAGDNYHNVVAFAKLSYEEASHLGFSLGYQDYGRDPEDDWAPEDWSDLTELWIVKIKQLRRQRDKLNRSKAVRYPPAGKALSEYIQEGFEDAKRQPGP